MTPDPTYGDPSAPFHALVLLVDLEADSERRTGWTTKPARTRRPAACARPPVVPEPPRFPDVPSGLGRIEAHPFDPDEARSRAAWSI